MPPKNEFEQLKEEVKQLKQELNTLRNAKNSKNIEQIDDELILEVNEVTNSNITTSYSVLGGGGGSVNAPSFFDNFLVRKHKGKVYLIPTYTLDKK